MAFGHCTEQGAVSMRTPVLFGLLPVVFLSKQMGRPASCYTRAAAAILAAALDGCGLEGSQAGQGFAI